MCVCGLGIFVCFEDFFGCRALAKPKMVQYDKIVDNALLRHISSAAGFPASSWHVIVAGSHRVKIMINWSVDLLPLRLHNDMILAQIFRQ